MNPGYYAVDGDCSLTRFLAGEFAQVFGPTEPIMATEAARALTAAVEEHGYGEEIPTNLLTLMIARILWTLNHRSEAEQYITEHLGARESLEMYLALLDRPDFDIRSWQILDSKILHPQAWDSLHQQSVWVLNLESLCHDRSLCYELSLYGLLRRLIEQLEAYGDQHNGEFYVALRGFSPMKQVASALEVKRFSEAVLKRMGTQRDWAGSPVVGFVDLPV